MFLQEYPVTAMKKSLDEIFRSTYLICVLSNVDNEDVYGVHNVTTSMFL